MPMPNATPCQPQPMDVVVRDGKPAMVRIRRRPLRIKEVLNIWRIDEEWCRKAVTRLYFLLEFESGMRLTVFHDLEKDSWYRQNWA
jgi:hypothetical protein